MDRKKKVENQFTIEKYHVRLVVIVPRSASRSARILNAKVHSSLSIIIDP